MSYELAGEHPQGQREVPEAAMYVQQDPRDGAWQAELVKRCRANDESAFAMIAEQYGNLLMRTAYLLTSDEEAAKDIVQDSLILAWKNLEKLREPTFLRAWLLKIVVNQATSLRRQLARKTAFLREQLSEQHVSSTIHTAEMQRGRLEDRIDLERAIGQLPLNQRVVLVLFYYHRMTMPEIAALLGTAENTLRKRQQAALDKIRRVLQADAATAQNSNLAQDSMHPGIGSIDRGGAR